MKFNIIFFTIGIILLFAAAIFEVNYFDYKSPVPYDQWQTISFYDFKGIKKPGLSLFGVSEFAYIKTSRKIYYPADGSVVITNYFHPSRSYVYERQLKSHDLLTHELYHFHIAEYITRLMRKELATGKSKISRSEIDGLEKKYYQMEIELQRQYDEDSYHSYVMQEQKRWETKVDSWLLSLQAYSMPEVPYKNEKLNVFIFE